METGQPWASGVDPAFGRQELSMAADDPTDGTIRQGEPPYPSAPRPYSASAGRLVPSTASRAAVVLVWSLRVVAVLIAAWAGLGAFFAMMFRFDSPDEFEMVKQFDVEVGGYLALAVILFFVPNRITKPVQCGLIVGVAALVWLFVSWNLIAHHEWVDRVRSGLAK
jgi:hypothetical protein